MDTFPVPAPAGAHIATMVQNAVELANRHRFLVEFVFNGVLVRVPPKSSPEAILEDWHHRLHRSKHGHPSNGLGEAVELLRGMKFRLGALMSAVTDFHDKIVAVINDIATDVDKIFNALQAIQNSPGTLSPADQASLDDALAVAQALKGKADADALPPPPPAQTGTGQTPNPAAPAVGGPNP